MLWKLEGVTLEDLIPVPKTQPGRHFTAGHHILGNLSSKLDAKYAQMTYGEHYRKKVEAALQLERQRCADLLTEQRKKASAQKTLTPSPVSSQTRPQPRYDLHELRHHQRRCAALLFGARERGAHKLPVLVRWAPKRRESYYLMSERVYNDRLLMKMRADAGDSPLNFDFTNTDGNTDDLHEFQRFINKTSKDIKQLSFDTKYNDYNYEFEEDKRKRLEQEGLYVGSTHDNETQDGKTAGHKGRRKVVFSDHVSESYTDAIDVKSLARSKRKGKRQDLEGLDPSDIDLIFEEDSEKENIEKTGNTFSSTKGELKKRRPNNSLSGLSSPNLLSLLQETPDDYSSDFTSDTESEAQSIGHEGNQSSLLGTADKIASSPSAAGKLNMLKHRNKHCKHALKQTTLDYYNKLPKLLKTAELRAKLPAKTQSRLQNTGKEADHHCMQRHKVAYDRALTLARFRSLPFSHSFLSRKISNMNTFSYFPGIPGSEKVLAKDDDDGNSKKKKKEPMPIAPSGRKAIFGDLDMDDFYAQEDELIYFINPEELKSVVASTTSGDESSRSEDQITSRSVTTMYTSRTNTATEADPGEGLRGLQPPL